MYYNAEMLAQIGFDEQLPELEGSDDVFNSSLMVGQDPNIISGGYDASQLFNGEISELNTWDYILPPKTITSMSKCSLGLKGSVLQWSKDNFKINTAQIDDIEDPTTFCRIKKSLLMFPQRKNLDQATILRTAHGGQLIVPTSEEESKMVMDIIEKRSATCIQSPSLTSVDKSVWLGAVKQAYQWYVLNDDKIVGKLNYSNWTPSKSEYPTDAKCAFIEKDGKWNFAFDDIKWFQVFKLCTIRSVVGTPVFTAKGFCDNTLFGWNYYMIVDDRHQIRYFDGYKQSKILRDNGSWYFNFSGNDIESRIDYDITQDKMYPVGRMKWNLYLPRCGIDSQKLLTLSQCEFENEFTCKSGRRVELKKAVLPL